MNVEGTVFGLLKTAWDTHSPSYNDGYPVEIAWPNTHFEPDPSKSWARATLQHMTSGQTSLGAKGGRKFTREGVITVQVFCPLNNGGSTYASALAKIARDAYEGESSDSMWFTDCTINEKGRDGSWFNVNMTATFQYDEHK